MASSSYPAALNFTLKYEGGYVNHPNDPGGPTNYGITQNVLAGWRGRPVSSTDVKNMPKSEAADIYRANYWRAVRGDDLPAGVDLVVWDYGVNSGPTRAIKALQSALSVNADGFIGAATIDAAFRADPESLVRAICAQRQRFIRGLNTYGTFGKGWERRIDACRALALSMVQRAPSAPTPLMSDPTPVDDEPGKARGSDESLMGSTTVRAGAGAAASGGIFALREGIEVAREAADASRSASEIAATVGPWLLLAVVVVAFGVYVIWHRRNQIRGNKE